MKVYVVEREALAKNIEFLKSRAGDTPIWAVLKGNGYGIGIIPFAKILSEHGIHQFCVTELREASALRENGFETEPILMLRETVDPAEINQLLDLHIILTVGSVDCAAILNGIAASRADMAEVHLKLDTGMGRYGFLPSETDKMISVYEYMKNIAVTGIYTHFHSAFSNDVATKRQYATFQSVVTHIQQAGYETGTVHCCNSSAFLRYPEMHCDGVRLGSAFLGRLSFPHNFPLTRIGYMEATIETLRWLPKEHTVGYGATWRAKEPTKIAVLSVGWYNGFGAERCNDTFRFRDCLRGILQNIKRILFRHNIIVTVNGHKCRVLGHIGMVNTIVDVTDIACAVGDRVICQVNPLTLKGVKIQYR